MARKKKQKQTIPRLTVKELLEKDYKEVSKFTEAEMRKHAKTLTDAANKRIKRLEAEARAHGFKGIFTIKGKRHFSTRALNRNQLYGLFSEVKKFLQSDITTLPGYRKVRERIKGRIREETNTQMSDQELEKFIYEADRILADTGKTIESMTYGSPPPIREIIAQHEQGKEFSYNKLKEITDKIYEEKEAKIKEAETYFRGISFLI